MPDSISYPLQFGMYRDGDNNLDGLQSTLLAEAKAVTANDENVFVNVLDTTRKNARGMLHSEQYDLANGRKLDAVSGPPQDMSDRAVLANFVAHTLDEAQRHQAGATWLDLIDHGGGDAGAFQTDISGGNMMSEDDIAGAIADGVRAHASAHPEDAKREVDGVIMNACLMATLGMESALSRVGVDYLAASPETMIAPGLPSSLAHDIAANAGNPKATADAIVDRAMTTQYCMQGDCFTPAAAFDVFDLDPKKIAKMEQSVTKLNAQLVDASKDPYMKSLIKADAKVIDGMTRGQEVGMPWHADRPAEAVYRNFANDAALPDALRDAAASAGKAIAATVLAHAESSYFAPFDGESYRDAAGPTVHFPLTRRQVDPWAPQVRETNTAFADRVHQGAVSNALATA